MATGTRIARILVLDNYDSFVFNLVQYMQQLGAEVLVRRNDEIAVADVAALAVDGVLISPGPGRPERAGISVPLVRYCAQERLPLLGVCLGHQAIAVAFGGEVDRAPELLHGKTSEIRHDGSGLLSGLAQPFTATRYHSLAAREATLPAELTVAARSESGVVMALRHASLPIHGVQFHPESVLTQGGHVLLANWLVGCGQSGARERVAALGAAVDSLRLTAFGDRALVGRPS